MKSPVMKIRLVALRVALILLLTLLTACVLPLPDLPGRGSTVAPGNAGPPYEDARSLMGSVCFEYWVAQVNRLFLIQSAAEHIAFYNEVDSSELCRFPVIREPYDFEVSGRILVGAVNIGTGCTAYTTPVALRTDDAARTVTLRVRWGVEGDCPYRLARPFWVSIPRPPEGYAVLLEAVPVAQAGQP